jgi:nicotinamidase-related amidase
MSESNEKTHVALLLIDFQKDFLSPDGRLPVAQNQVLPVLQAASQALSEFRSQGLPVVAVGNEFRRGDPFNLFRRFASIQGSPGAAWDQRLPIDGAQYFPKWGGSAFGNPALEPWLRDRGVTGLVLTGLQAKACVTATAKDAVKRGFRVFTIDEAIACASDATRERALTRLHATGVVRLRSGLSAGPLLD